MVWLIPILAVLVLAELYALALQCRNGHAGWKELALFRYAHRGYHEKPYIPENSMAAFRRAPILGLYISRIHTPRDTVFDERNIRLLTDSSLRLISSL